MCCDICKKEIKLVDGYIVDSETKKIFCSKCVMKKIKAVHQQEVYCRAAGQEQGE